MLHGMGEPIQRAAGGAGLETPGLYALRAILSGMAYLVRRLLENTSNESFLKASFVDHARVEDLLRNPEEVGAMFRRGRKPPGQADRHRRPPAVPQRAVDRLQPGRGP